MVEKKEEEENGVGMWQRDVTEEEIFIEFDFAFGWVLAVMMRSPSRMETSKEKGIISVQR